MEDREEPTLGSGHIMAWCLWEGPETVTWLSAPAPCTVGPGFDPVHQNILYLLLGAK
jgi:hypothetical protein